MNQKIIILGILGCIIMPVAISMIGPARVGDRSRPLTWAILASSYTRTAPFTITSDSDWITYATGSGTLIDPWVIEGLLIECNGTGSGISISGTTDVAIIRDSFINESGSGALDAGIMITSAVNITLSNVTVEDAGAFGIALYSSGNNCTIKNCTVTRSYDAGVALAFVAGSNNVTGNTLRNCSYGANTAAINLITVSNDNIEYNDIDQLDAVQLGIGVGGGSTFVTITGNLVNNTELSGSAMGIAALSASNLVVTGNRVDNAPASLEFGSTTGSYIANNTCTTASYGGFILDTGNLDNTITGNVVENATYGVYINGGASNQSITNNRFINCTSFAIANDDTVTPAIQWNYIKDCGHGVAALYGTNVSYNTFDNTTVTLPADPDTFDHNAYGDYFTLYPTVTKNGRHTGDVLPVAYAPASDITPIYSELLWGYISYVPVASFRVKGGVTSLESARLYTFQFDGTVVDTPATFAWDFGDGTTSSAASPSHKFAKGTYAVTLVVTDADGDSDTSSTVFHVTSTGGGGNDDDGETDTTGTLQAIMFGVVVGIAVLAMIAIGMVAIKHRHG